MAIQSSGENGNKNANNGISDFRFGDANNDTPLWKYGMLKSITCALALHTIQFVHGNGENAMEKNHDN